MAWDIFHWSLQNVPGYKYPQFIPTGYLSNAGSSNSSGLVTTKKTPALTDYLVGTDVTSTIKTIAIAGVIVAGLYYGGRR